MKLCGYPPWGERRILECVTAPSFKNDGSW